MKSRVRFGFNSLFASQLVWLQSSPSLLFIRSHRWGKKLPEVVVFLSSVVLFLPLFLSVRLFSSPRLFLSLCCSFFLCLIVIVFRSFSFSFFPSLFVSNSRSRCLSFLPSSRSKHKNLK